MLLDEPKVQDGEAKNKSQLPADFVKETLVAEFDGANPTSPRNVPPMIHNGTATDIKELNKSNVQIFYSNPKDRTLELKK